MNRALPKSLTSVGLFFILSFNSFTSLSCTRKQNLFSSQKQNSTVRVAVRYFPYTLDWNKNISVNGFNGAITEPLISYDLSSSPPKLTPALATHWEPHDKFKVWKVHIRKNLKWSNGTQVSTQNIIDSFERFLAPQTAAPLASVLYPIKNARPFNTGQLPFSRVGIRQLSSHTIEFTLERSLAHFPHLLTLHQLSPIPTQLIKTQPTNWTQAEHLLSVGPYKRETYKEDQFIALQANPHYWKGIRSVKRIEGHNVQDPTTALRLFESGKIDLAFSIPSEELHRVRKKPEFHSIQGSSPVTLILDPHFKTGKNIELRRALDLAIDRSELVKVHGLIHAEHYWLPEIFGLLKSPPKGKEIQKAQKHLRKAQLPQNFKLQLFISTNSNERRIAENIQHQLKVKLGIDLELKVLDEKILRQKSQNHLIPFYMITMGPDYYHPHSLMEFFTSNSSQNIIKWTNKSYDKLIKKAARSHSSDKRNQVYQKANQLLKEQAPIIPLFTYTYPYLLSLHLSGFVMPPFYRIDFRNLQYKKPK